jgi:ABC-type multidrug transport system fused ATPase/permease subunit
VKYSSQQKRLVLNPYLIALEGMTNDVMKLLRELLHTLFEMLDFQMERFSNLSIFEKQSLSLARI